MIRLALLFALLPALASAQVTITPASAVNGGGVMTVPLVLPNGNVTTPSLQIGTNAGLYNDLGGYLMFSNSGNNPVSIATNSLVLKSDTLLQWANNVTWSGPDLILSKIGDGILRITNGAATGFTRLILGTNDASGVAIKKVSTDIHFVVGNDSGDTSIRAFNVTGSNALIAGTTSAATGAVRLSYGEDISFRNNANGADIDFGRVGTWNSTTDRVVVDPGGVGAFFGGAISSAIATGTLVTNDAQSVAVDQVIVLGTNALNGYYVISNTTDGTQALIAVDGVSTSTRIVDSYGGGTYYSITKDTASKVNVYWETDSYKLQNKRGGSVSIRLVRLGL